MPNGSRQEDGNIPPPAPEGTGGSVEQTPGQPEATPVQREAVQHAAEILVQEAQVVAQTRRSLERTYNTNPEHARRVDVAIERSGRIAPWLDIVDPIISEIPVLGDVAGVGLDLYVLGEAINAGVPTRELVKILGIVGLELVIGLAIPVPVLDEIFPSNMICRWILKRYGDKIRAARARELGQPEPAPQAGPLPIGPNARRRNQPHPSSRSAPRRQLPPRPAQ